MTETQFNFLIAFFLSLVFLGLIRAEITPEKSSPCPIAEAMARQGVDCFKSSPQDPLE